MIISYFSAILVISLALPCFAQQAPVLRWWHLGAKINPWLESLTTVQNPGVIYTSNQQAVNQTWPLVPWQLPKVNGSNLGGYTSPPHMPNGDSALITAYGPEVREWIPGSNSVRSLGTYGWGYCTSIDVSPDGSLIAAIMGDTARVLTLIDRKSGAALWSMPCSNGPVGFSPDGKMLLASLGYTFDTLGSTFVTRRLVLIDVKTHSVIHWYTQVFDAPTSYVWNPQSHATFVVWYESTLDGLIMDTSGAVIAHVPLFAYGQSGADFSLDGSMLVGYDSVGLAVCHLSDMHIDHLPNGNDSTYITNVVFLNDDTVISTSSDRVTLYSCSKHQLRTLSTRSYFSLSYSGDGTKLLTDGDGVLDPVTGEFVANNSECTVSNYRGDVAVGVGNDGSLALWESSTDSVAVLRGRIFDTTPNSALAVFSPSDTAFAVAVGNINLLWQTDPRNALELWSVKTKSVIRRFTAGMPAYAISGIAFSHDGRLIAASANGSCYVFDVGTGHPVMVFQLDDPGANLISFMSGDTLILCSDGIYSLWGRQLVVARIGSPAALLPDGMHALGLMSNGVSLPDVIIMTDLQSGTSTPIESFDWHVKSLAVNPVTGDFAVCGQNLFVYSLSGSAGIETPYTLSNPSLDAYADHSRISMTLPSARGSVYVYRSDGRCFYSSQTQAGLAKYTTGPLPAGVYFVVFQAQNGERRFAKVSLLE